MPFGSGWRCGARRVAALLVVCVLPAAALLAQQPATADSSLPLFAVMAAINAAGYDAGLDSPYSSPIRRQVRQEIAAAKPASLEALRKFYAAHRQADAARDLSQFVSFALLVKGPPDFAFRVKEPDLPPDVAALRDFRPLLAAFYQEADLEKLWEKHRPAYERELERYDEGLAQVMFEVNGYLRVPSSGYLGRNFWVYADLLGAPGQANARSFGQDYYAVLSTAAQPQLDQVRHGYLHYLLEPMAGKYGSLVRSKSDLKAFAEEAHALDPVLRKDFRLLLSESLIRAVELRMSRGAPASREQRLRDILTEGHFLAPYFYEALELFEKQEAGMRHYYPDMVEKLDVRREQKRLAKVTFREASAEGQAPHSLALAPAGPAPAGAQHPAAPGASGAGGTSVAPGASDEEKGLAKAEDAMARRDYAVARQLFRAALERNGPLRARAVYGLALVATQEKQPEVAKSYFQQTLAEAGDPHLVAWAHIYLGRIYDMEEKRDLAVRHYQQALEAQDKEPAARQAAERGLKAPFRRETSGREEGDPGKKH